MIEIDDGVPIPPTKGRGRKLGESKYRFGELAIGQSIFVEGFSATLFGGNVSGAKKAYGFKFTMRTVTENGVKGVRVWRIE